MEREFDMAGNIEEVINRALDARLVKVMDDIVARTAKIGPNHREDVDPKEDVGLRGLDFLDMADQLDILTKKLGLEDIIKKVDKMQSTLRKQQGTDIYELDNLGQYKDLYLPYNFKMPPMSMFDGTGDPHIHVKQYILAMRSKNLTKFQITKIGRAHV